jgi:hypothetical protein
MVTQLHVAASAHGFFLAAFVARRGFPDNFARGGRIDKRPLTW